MLDLRPGFLLFNPTPPPPFPAIIWVCSWSSEVQLVVSRFKNVYNYHLILCRHVNKVISFFSVLLILTLFFFARVPLAARNPQRQGKATREKLLERHRLQVNIRNRHLVQTPKALLCLSCTSHLSVSVLPYRFESLGFSTRHTHEC